MSCASSVWSWQPCFISFLLGVKKLLLEIFHPSYSINHALNESPLWIISVQEKKQILVKIIWVESHNPLETFYVL